MENTKRVGRLLKMIRKSKDMKLSELSELSGVSVPMISLMENGKRGSSKRIVERVCRAFNIPYEVVMFRSMNISEMEFGASERFNEIQPHINQILDEVFNIKVLDIEQE